MIRVATAKSDAPTAGVQFPPTERYASAKIWTMGYDHPPTTWHQI
jgi:hypothetical protein